MPVYSDKLHKKNKKPQFCGLANIFFKVELFIFELTNIII
ncbi:protein of unknown function [Xenorhabdus doucetiae]|uniref:Uncharacterized protein n=1 Tax=Xenorhabdus doucetiae TaxID=351671 RepID=A0A068QNP6_9GAMM|nr:protein of unknown function [Xenorhabdus doucetiae]